MTQVGSILWILILCIFLNSLIFTQYLGGPDLETKIVELQIAISNAKTDKAKAEARLDRLREGGIAVDEYIDAYVMERQRQQEAAEAQRRRDAERAAAEAGDSGGNDEEPRENYEMQQVRTYNLKGFCTEFTIT